MAENAQGEFAKLGVNDQRKLRDAFGDFVTGVTVITAKSSDGELVGCTANSFSSLSLDPPLILWSLANTARSYDAFMASERFTINVLGESQKGLSNRFARRGADKFGGDHWSPGLGGVPVIDGAICVFECRQFATYPGGDHTIFVGQVENYQRKPERPLVFGGGRYLTAFDDMRDSLPKEVSEGNRARFEAQRLAIAHLPEICITLGRSVGISVWGNEGPVTLYWEVSKGEISKDILTGYVCSLVGTSTGRAFAAWLPESITAPKMDTDLARAKMNQSDFETLLHEIRAKGFVQLDMTETGLKSCAAPVYDSSGLMILALTTIEPTSGDAPPCDVTQLVKEAQKLSHQLGYQPPETTR